MKRDTFTSFAGKPPEGSMGEKTIHSAAATNRFLPRGFCRPSAGARNCTG
jgi:hypothetical protein